MAQILTSYFDKLVVAISDNVQKVSDHFLGEQIINSEVYDEILQTTTISGNAKQAARTLLLAIGDAVATDQTIFEVMMEILRVVLFSSNVPPFMQEMDEQYQDLKCEHSRSRKRKRTDSDPTEEVNQSDTIVIGSRKIIVELFIEKLIPATSSSIPPLCDQYVSTGLISKETHRRLCETKVNSKEDKARISLQAIMETIENDDRCFDIFLTTLHRTLPIVVGSKLVAEIIEESKKYTVTVLDDGLLAEGNGSDIRDKYQEATTKLEEAHRDIKKLKEDLELKIQENEKLQKKLSELRADGSEKKNAKEIEKLKEKITKYEHEISQLQKKVEEKEKEVEFWDMKMKRERELFQKESGLASYTKIKELEMELSETLKVRKQDLEKELGELQQTKARLMKDYTKEIDDLQGMKSALLTLNGLLQSSLNTMKRLHSDSD